MLALIMLLTRLLQYLLLKQENKKVMLQKQLPSKDQKQCILSGS
jgi:hypothetical protein